MILKSCWRVGERERVQPKIVQHVISTPLNWSWWIHIVYIFLALCHTTIFSFYLNSAMTQINSRYLIKFHAFTFFVKFIAKIRANKIDVVFMIYNSIEIVTSPCWFGVESLHSAIWLFGSKIAVGMLSALTLANGSIW